MSYVGLVQFWAYFEKVEVTPAFIQFNTCFNCLHFVNCVMWLLFRHPPKPAAKLAHCYTWIVALLAYALFTWILNVVVGTLCFKNELAMTHQHRYWCLLLRRNRRWDKQLDLNNSPGLRIFETRHLFLESPGL